jgi:lipoyl(octanoyl) transferase
MSAFTHCHRSTALVPYSEALAQMESWHHACVAGGPAHLWLVSHPPVYTAGTGVPPEEQPARHDIPCYRTGRGGKMTYHGPAQRMGYSIRHLQRDAARAGALPDIRRYVWTLEAWVIAALRVWGIAGERRPGRVGIWVVHPRTHEDAKIAAIGVRIRQWVTLHGIALYVGEDHTPFSSIVPCGLRGYGVASLADYGVTLSQESLDYTLCETYHALFSDV